MRVAAIDGATDEFAAVVAQVCQTPGAVCDRATAAPHRLQDADAQVDEIATVADRVATGNAELADAMGRSSRASTIGSRSRRRRRRRHRRAPAPSR